jgi:hypothetical protein
MRNEVPCCPCWFGENYTFLLPGQKIACLKSAKPQKAPPDLFSTQWHKVVFADVETMNKCYQAIKTNWVLDHTSRLDFWSC